MRRIKTAAGQPALRQEQRGIGQLTGIGQAAQQVHPAAGFMFGRVLVEAAEKWLKEYGVDHIVITSQDRAAGFYEKLGYKLNPDADLSVYDHHAPKKDEEPKKPKKNLGFTCVLVEKYV